MTARVTAFCVIFASSRILVSGTYSDRALKRANERAPNQELINLFRAAIFLDEETTPNSWRCIASQFLHACTPAFGIPAYLLLSSLLHSNLGVALLHQAGATSGAEAGRHGLWSLVNFELARRMDPLLLVGAGMVDANVGLLKEKCPSIEPIISTGRRAYWRGNLLLTSPSAGEVGLTLAQAGREAESITFFWIDLLESDKDSTVAQTQLPHSPCKTPLRFSPALASLRLTSHNPIRPSVQPWRRRDLQPPGSISRWR